MPFRTLHRSQFRVVRLQKKPVMTTGTKLLVFDKVEKRVDTTKLLRKKGAQDQLTERTAFKKALSKVDTVKSIYTSFESCHFPLLFIAGDVTVSAALEHLIAYMPSSDLREHIETVMARSNVPLVPTIERRSEVPVLYVLEVEGNGGQCLNVGCVLKINGRLTISNAEILQCHTFTRCLLCTVVLPGIQLVTCAPLQRAIRCIVITALEKSPMGNTSTATLRLIQVALPSILTQLEIVSVLFVFSHAVHAMTAPTVVRVRKTKRVISKPWDPETNKKPTPTQTKQTTQTNTRQRPKKIRDRRG